MALIESIQRTGLDYVDLRQELWVSGTSASGLLRRTTISWIFLDTHSTIIETRQNPVLSHAKAAAMSDYEKIARQAEADL